VSEEKIYMLNALWFQPGDGARKYREYLKAAAPYLRAVGGRMHSALYAPQAAIIGEFDADLVFFVEYPSLAAFEKMARDPGYQAQALPLREAAIRKSLLIRCAAKTAGA
jgi:uncharacterized protein (DUF1330 family)